MDTTTRIAALRTRQLKINTDANERIAEIASKAMGDVAKLNRKIEWLQDGGEFVKANKLAAIEAEADAIAAEDAAAAQAAAMARAEKVLATRKEMAARGEDIYVPRDAAEMLAIMDAMEGDTK